MGRQTRSGKKQPNAEIPVQKKVVKVKAGGSKAVAKQTDKSKTKLKEVEENAYERIL